MLHHIHLNVVQGVLYTHRVTSDVWCGGSEYRCFRVLPRVCIYTHKQVDRTTYLSTNNNMLCVLTQYLHLQCSRSRGDAGLSLYTPYTMHVVCY